MHDLATCGHALAGEAPGVWGYSATVERVIQALHSRLGEIGVGRGTEVISFPPVMSRRTLERSGYLEGFPHLVGSVHGFAGQEPARARMLARVQAGADWGELQVQSDVVLVPAACYPVYPHLSGVLPAGGRELNLFAYCFRHEETAETGRLRSFRVEEFVRAGDPATCSAWRDEWLERGHAFLADLGLDVRRRLASDPFFGRAGRLLAADQRNRRLKWELQVPLHSETEPTAIASFNRHDDHFARSFGIELPGGGVAHTACVGFGVERIAFALLRAHGLAPERWPPRPRRELRL